MSNCKDKTVSRLRDMSYKANKQQDSQHGNVGDSSRNNQAGKAKATADENHERLKRHSCFAIPADNIPLSPKQSNLVRILEACYRGGELVIAFFALLLTLPIIIIEAIAIRIESPGHPLFVVNRMAQSKLTPGRDLAGRSDVKFVNDEFDPEKLYYAPRTFRFVKIRSMYKDAAERWPEYFWWNYDIPEEQLQHMHYKLDDDPRITRVGKWIRITSIDELPNLWNVLRGDVRLVGPRPETMEIAARYTPEQMIKFTIKPGITCLAEINGRGNLSMQERVDWDLEYIKKRTLKLDLKILFITFWQVIWRKGAF